MSAPSPYLARAGPIPGSRTSSPNEEVPVAAIKSSEQINIHSATQEDSEKQVNEILKKIVEHHKTHPHANFDLSGHLKSGVAAT